MDTHKDLADLKEDISSELGKKMKGTDVAVNMVSGSGKEHMALLSALLGLGMGLRFVAATKDGIKEL